MFSQNKTHDEQSGSNRAWDADAFLERKSLRSLLARPFYWLGFLSAVLLILFLWSAEHVEGVSATDEV